MKLTLERVVSWIPCSEYRDNNNARLLELYPSKEADLTDVLRDDRIPVEDRVWVGCHALPWETIEPVVVGWVERAIRRCLGKSGIPEWEAWAERWLSGKDRTGETAWDASWAIGPATAVRAARAARAASAARAVEVAELAAWAARAAAAAAREEEAKKQLEEITEVVVNMKGA